MVMTGDGVDPDAFRICAADMRDHQNQAVRNDGKSERQEIVRRRPPRFDLSAGVVCLDFINTLDNRPSGEPKELLSSFIDLARFGEDSLILDPNQVEKFFRDSQIVPERTQEALAQAIELREALFAIFSSVMKKSETPVGAMQTLNAYLRMAGDHSQLVLRNGHFSWGFRERFSYDAVLWPIAQSAADLLTSDQLAFVRTCSSPTCQWFFLDTSKNHRRRWCNMKLCGNRDKVRRFYERQKQAET
jgi:predicted RNA-binding Zn ribbon-like protein